MLKIDLILIAKRVHYYLFLQKHLLEPITKIKPRCPCHLLNSENTQFFCFKYESIQREACERKLDLLPSPPPLLLCHQISKTYISFSLLLIC